MGWMGDRWEKSVKLNIMNRNFMVDYADMTCGAYGHIFHLSCLCKSKEEKALLATKPV